MLLWLLLFRYESGTAILLYSKDDGSDLSLRCIAGRTSGA
jgi:hypothetical protein